MVNRKITGTIALDGRLFRTGDEAALAETARKRRVDLMSDVFASGLAGDWSDLDDAQDDALPERFPGFRHLEAAGIITYSDLAGVKVSDVEGISLRTAKAITKALANR